MHGSALFVVCRFVKLLRHQFRKCTEILVRSAAGLRLKPLCANVKDGHCCLN